MPEGEVVNKQGQTGLSHAHCERIRGKEHILNHRKVLFRQEKEFCMSFSFWSLIYELSQILGACAHIGLRIYSVGLDLE